MSHSILAGECSRFVTGVIWIDAETKSGSAIEASPEPVLNNSDVRPRSHRVRATHPAQYETVLGGGDRLLIDPDDLLGGGDLRLQRRLGQHRENDVAGRIEIDRLQLEALIIDATCRRMPPNMSSVQDRLKPGLYSVNVGMLVPMKEPPNSALEIRSRVTEAEAPIEGICAPCSARRFSRASRNVTWAAARSGFASRAWVTSASMRDEWNRFHQSPGMSRRVRRRCAVPPVVAALAVRVGVGCSVKRSASGGAERWKSGPTVQPASMVAADSAAPNFRQPWPVLSAFVLCFRSPWRRAPAWWH
jgi:hypothetical protein